MEVIIKETEIFEPKIIDFECLSFLMKIENKKINRECSTEFLIFFNCSQKSVFKLILSFQKESLKILASI